MPVILRAENSSQLLSTQILDWLWYNANLESTKESHSFMLNTIAEEDDPFRADWEQYVLCSRTYDLITCEVK